MRSKMILTKDAPLLPTARTPLEKPCTICGKPNSAYGFGVSLLHGRKGLWACNEHRSQVEKIKQEP